MAACAWLSFCFAKIGELTDADRYSAHAVEFADQSDHPQQQAIAYTMHATTLVYRGLFAEAVSLCQRALHLCETKALLVWLPGAAATLGWALVASGRPADGLPQLERAVSIFEAIGLKSHLSQVCGWWGEALLALERFDEARSTALRSLDLARAYGEEGYEVEAQHVLARVMMATDLSDRDRVVNALAEVAERSRALGMSPLHARSLLSLGEAEKGRSRFPQAAAHAQAAVTLFDALGMSHERERAEVFLRTLA
jgi:tetratricopeptide (TPR) repeat protein